MSEMKIQETKVNGIEPVEIKQGTPGMVQDSNVTLVSQKNVSRESEKLRENFQIPLICGIFAIKICIGVYSVSINLYMSNLIKFFNTYGKKTKDSQFDAASHGCTIRHCLCG